MFEDCIQKSLLKPKNPLENLWMLKANPSYFQQISEREKNALY